MNELDVLVLGGGVSGLSIADNLSRSGMKVEVWESSGRIGGKVQTHDKEGYQLENGPSMIMNIRSELNSFLASTRLESGILSRSPVSERYILNENQLYTVPTGLCGLLSSPLISPAGKLRLLREPLVQAASNNDETVAEFVTRRLGREFLEKLFEPYLAGPLASDVEQAEARSTMPALKALEKKYGSLTLGALLKKIISFGSTARPQVFSFAGGMSTLTQTLSVESGFNIRTNLTAGEIWPVTGGWMGRGFDQIEKCTRTLFSKQLVICTPAYVAADLMLGLDSRLAKLLSSIEYAPIKVVHTGFDRSDVKHRLDGSGFLVPRSSRFKVNGCQWLSSLFPHKAPPGKVLLSNYLGGARNPAAAEWDTNQVLDNVMPMFTNLFGIKNDPRMLHIKTHSRALPLYHGAYAQRLQNIQECLARLPGLYLEGNYKGGVSIRDRILCAEAVSKRILAHADRQKHGKISTSEPVSQNIAQLPAAIGGVQ